jgi:septal ring factor EnvC (AmiA/AmiB activator)
MDKVRPILVPYEQAVCEAITNFLAPMQSIMPQAVQAVINALNDGRRPGPAGEALVEALQNRITEVRNEAAEKRSTLYDQIRDLEQRVREHQEKLRLSQIEIDKVNKKYEEEQRIIVDLQTRISVQNRLLAQQHEQIVNLCGMQEEDAHT